MRTQQNSHRMTWLQGCLVAMLFALATCSEEESGFKTVGVDDSLCTATIVGDQGEEFRCDVEFIAGSIAFEMCIMAPIQRPTGMTVAEDAMVTIFRTAGKLATRPYAFKDVYSSVKENCLLEQFKTREASDGRRGMASRAKIRFSRPEIPFEAMKKVLCMSNVHYRDEKHKVSGMDEVCEFVDAFWWLGFDPAAKVGLTMRRKGRRKGAIEAAWISKHLMFAINLAKAVSNAGGGLMDEVRKAAAGEVEEGAGEAVKRLGTTLKKASLLGEYLRTIRIETLEALETQNSENIPFEIEEPYSDNPLSICPLSEALYMADALVYGLWYLHKVNKSKTFRVATLRLDMADPDLPQEHVLSCLEKTFEMFPRIERVCFEQVSSGPLGCKSRFGAAGPKTFAEEVLDLVLDRVEKNAGIEGLVLEQYDAASEERVVRMQQLPGRILGLGRKTKAD